MIKILATSDWHLGNTFHQHDRDEEFAHFLQQLGCIIKEQQPHLLLVGGDIFDNSNPSAAAQQLYYDFLASLQKLHPTLHTLIIAGNHDSALRIEAPKQLLRSLHVEVRGQVRRKEQGIDYDDLIIPYTQPQSGERVWLLAVPYLRDSDLERGDSYSGRVNSFLEQLLARVNDLRSPGEAVVLLAHLYATGAQIAENSSERVVVGGQEVVNLKETGERVTLALLGHIHKRQHVGECRNMRYVGSALPMSFAECGNHHGAELYTLDNGVWDGKAQFFEFTPLHPLLSLPRDYAPLTEVLEELRELPIINDALPYLEVKVLLDAPDTGLVQKVEQALEGKPYLLCRIPVAYQKSGGEALEESGQVTSLDDLSTLNPVEIIKAGYEKKNGCAMRDELVQLANQVVDRVKEQTE